MPSLQAVVLLPYLQRGALLCDQTGCLVCSAASCAESLCAVGQGRSWAAYNVSLAEGAKPTWLIEGAVASIGERILAPGLQDCCGASCTVAGLTTMA